ncbi:MAG: thiocillin family RiPP [Thiohalobacteraceae bacterium]
MNEFTHSFDISFDSKEDFEVLNRAAFFAESEQKVDDGGFDCAGTVGTFGSVGGCAGTFGTFGCCC